MGVCYKFTLVWCSFIESRFVVFRNMNYYYCYYQQQLNSEEMMRMESLVCPKPRRLAFSNSNSNSNHHYSSSINNNNNIRPLRCPISYQSRIEQDSGVGAELLDIIHSKKAERSSGDNKVVLASSPPFFCGSPPSRASNPVIQDEQFGNGNGNFSPFTMASSSSPPSSSSKTRGGCVPMKFGNTPAVVRVEGFDCLSRDRNRNNCSISAVA